MSCYYYDGTVLSSSVSRNWHPVSVRQSVEAVPHGPHHNGTRRRLLSAAASAAAATVSGLGRTNYSQVIKQKGTEFLLCFWLG